MAAETHGDAAQFLAEHEPRLLELAIESQKAGWVFATYITDDTEALSVKADARSMAATVALAKQATAFRGPGLEGSVERRLRLLRTALSLVPPSEGRLNEELNQVVAAMQSRYAKGTYQPKGTEAPLDVQGLSRLLGTSRDLRLLEDAWTGWHALARPMRGPFERYVELANQGAREAGFPDTGAMWRSKYEMLPEEFARDVDRVWEQVRPLYASLHAYVRGRLRATFGDGALPRDGPIPAHLLGNMWAQDWALLFPIARPEGADPGYDLTERLVAKGTTPLEMVKYAERFFDSLGFDPLPTTFWERSLFVRPADRQVVCHASAWDLDFDTDLRIKMCIEVNDEDFQTIHHELGHVYYDRAYRRQPFLFRDSANDGFHEAVGDTIALSVTPEYLVRVGLLDHAPPPEKDLGLLLRRALEKVAFLPFGLLVDQWRWKVFAGEVTPATYTSSWWQLKRKYQGVVPPGPRSDEEFDPGAKFHVAASVPYMRYFLAHVLQFQFHRALARIAGGDGPLHRASIYGNRDAGGRLIRMLEMGTSRPWPEALESLTGERRLDGTAMLEYFAPLKKWLDVQNRDQPVGW